MKDQPKNTKTYAVTIVARVNASCSFRVNAIDSETAEALAVAMTRADPKSYQWSLLEDLSVGSIDIYGCDELEVSE